MSSPSVYSATVLYCVEVDIPCSPTLHWHGSRGISFRRGFGLAATLPLFAPKSRGCPCPLHRTVIVGTGPLSIAEVVAVAGDGARVELSGEAVAAIEGSRAHVEALAESGQPVYGISTGFGALATRFIEAEKRTQLQRSLVRSHAAGSGPCVETEVVRALMLLRLSTLATGRTGVRPKTAQAYANLLNAHITPCVPEYGSLGCSGDLAPLAHCALAVMGEGVVADASGELKCAAEALAVAGLEPVELAEKEGLALINGTDGMLGMLALAITDLTALVKVADISAAMSVEALLGTDAVYAADLQALRPHPGPGREREQHDAAARRQRHSRVARRGRHASAGRLLVAMRAAGRGRRARHARARTRGGRARTRIGGRQPRRAAGRSHPEQRQLPRRARRLRPRLPRDRRGRSRVDRRAPDRPHARQERAATGCRRSSPTIPGWTRVT